MNTAEHTDLTVVHITDTHFTDTGDLLRGRVDTRRALHHILQTVEASGGRVDALVLSGDLTDDGGIEAYRALRDIVDAAATRLSAQVVYAVGNHDERTAFRAGLFGSDGTGDTPYDTVHDVDGLRIVVLDSTTPGRHDGRLTDAQLIWLQDELARPSLRGSLLVLHHPPIPSPVATVDLLRLQEPERLAAVVAGTDVRMILCGHAHMTGAGSIAGIPVWIGPAASYRVDPFAPTGRHRGREGTGFSRIDIVRDTIVATAVDGGSAELLYDTDEHESLAQIRDHHSETV